MKVILLRPATDSPSTSEILERGTWPRKPVMAPPRKPPVCQTRMRRSLIPTTIRPARGNLERRAFFTDRDTDAERTNVPTTEPEKMASDPP
jgi:hypothetical protein